MVKRYSLAEIRARLEPAEVMRRDLRRALLHEIAHALVASYFGARGFLQVWRYSGGDLENTYFAGSFTITRKPTRSRRRAMILIGLAGFLAEFQDAALDEQKSDALLAAESFKVAAEAGGVSESDLQLSIGATVSDFRRCLRALTVLRHRLDAEVETNLLDGINSERWNKAAP